MTKKRAVRLTGYEVRQLPPEGGLVMVAAFEGERLVVKAVGRADFGALQALVNTCGDGSPCPSRRNGPSG